MPYPLEGRRPTTGASVAALWEGKDETTHSPIWGVSSQGSNQNGFMEESRVSLQMEAMIPWASGSLEIPVRLAWIFFGEWELWDLFHWQIQRIAAHMWVVER